MMGDVRRTPKFKIGDMVYVVDANLGTVSRGRVAKRVVKFVEEPAGDVGTFVTYGVDLRNNDRVDRGEEKVFDNVRTASKVLEDADSVHLEPLTMQANIPPYVLRSDSALPAYGPPVLLPLPAPATEEAQRGWIAHGHSTHVPHALRFTARGTLIRWIDSYDNGGVTELGNVAWSLVDRWQYA